MPYPFGPYLSIGGAVTYLFGYQIQKFLIKMCNQSKLTAANLVNNYALP